MATIPKSSARIFSSVMKDLNQSFVSNVFKVIWLFMLITSTFQAKSQEYLDTLDIVLYSEAPINNKEVEYEELLVKWRTSSDFGTENLADCLHEIGKWYYRNRGKNFNDRFLDSAISKTKKSAELKLKISSPDTTSIKKTLYNLGLFQYRRGSFFEAIESYDKLLNLGEIDKKSLAAYRNLAQIQKNIGDFEKSVNTWNQILYHYNKNGIGCSTKAKAHIDLATTYWRMEATQYQNEFEKNLAIAESTLESCEDKVDILIAMLLHLKGNYLITDEQYEKALDVHYQILELENSISNTDKASLLNSIGVSLTKLGKFDEAISFLKQAIDLDSAFSGPYENLGDIYCKINDFEQALNFYSNAIQKNLPANELLQINGLPDLELFQVSNNKDALLSHLIAKANAWLDYYKHDGNTAHLTQALATFERADELIDIIRSQSTEYQSKLYWRGQSSKLYMKAVEVSFLLDRPDKAYYFMERNKALLLLEDITHEKAKELSQLPDSIAKREFELKRAIHLAENTLQNNSGASQDSLQNFKNDIFQYKRSYEKFMDSLTTAFPDYARLKQQFQVLPYPNFTFKINSEQTASLQFILNDEQGYALLHANGEPQFYELENAESLNKNILDFYANLSKFDKDLTSTYEVSNVIFNTLIPETAFESIKNKELIIVPDYNLQKIPFEALVTDTAHRRYLLEDVELRYAYSLSYLEAKKQLQTQAEEDLLALAPVDFENLGLAKLGFSGLEVDALKSIFGGETWLNEEASKENLLKNLDKHGILHFATHADIDENGNHWVAFSDDKLYLNEIYATRNQAKMVVLSACNTSRGELKNGEGVMSLARAFFNSGAKSVVSSLWPTVDKTSKDIMVDFYSGLDEGLPKATALRNAKLKYLQNNPGASPAQWAALIVIGDNSPVRHPSILKDNWPWIVLVGGLLIIPVFLWRRRQNLAA